MLWGLNRHLTQNVHNSRTLSPMCVEIKLLGLNGDPTKRV